MITNPGVGGLRGDERRLVRNFRSLGEEDRITLLKFSEFLEGQSHPDPGGEPKLLEPEPLPRPERESVVGAIKRLSRGYHMLERGAMLTETSSLMSGHVLNGRPAAQVIDDLEALFARRYAVYREANKT